ncbi:hypothetical protein [Algibacter sp. 2305UL17-15]|uniref:hypothetical protein n=1 Tax=Algibacter sp. 2305UL17-15 TaxID=3231268 RepID=UPI00345A8E9D
MKKIKYGISLLLVMFTTLGCDELEELLEQEIEVQTTFITELEINVPNAASPDEAVDFESNFGFWDFKKDPNVLDVIGSTDEITKLEINSVRYFYKDVVGNENAHVEGAMVFVVGQGNESYNTAQTNLKQADFNNTLFTLNGDFSPVNAAMTQNKTIGFSYKGSVSDNPVSFIADVSISVTVTIKPDLDNI